MFRKNVSLFLILFPGLCIGQHIKYKMIHMQSPAVGKYMLHILPWGYDSNTTDEQMARCVDTLPGHPLAAKMYNILYKDDTTRLAVKIEEGLYLFSKKRYTIEVYWKNGNKKYISLVTKRFKKYHQFVYHENDAPAACGCFKNGHKVGRWVYFNTQGLKVKVEHYAKDGTVKSSKTIDPPKKTLRTIFNTRHLAGTPYIIQ
jgi:hypothetical protein